jgi:putative addiction module killer protein
MYDIKQTEPFSKWLLKLKDLQGKIAIARRVERMRKGNFGDHKSVGDNVSELRITKGPSYRVYYTIKQDEIIILLVGGDKSSQQNNIQTAKTILKEYENG